MTRGRSVTPRSNQLLITCEHGGHAVPTDLRPMFLGAGEILRSHRGWDPGALAVAVELAAGTSAPLLATTISRLVVECNRSVGHPRLFSEFTRHLDPSQRKSLLDRCYFPHRHAVESILEALTRVSPTVHLGIHSFTPVLDGYIRRVDIGILFDPARPFERSVAGRLRRRILHAAPGLRVRFNAPYRGTSDGLTTALRGRFSVARYAGIEIEINQNLVRSRARQRAIAGLLIDAAVGRDDVPAVTSGRGDHSPAA